MSEKTGFDYSAAKYLLPAAAGALTGLRSATPVAVLSWFAKEEGWLASPVAGSLLGAAAVGEWVVDKLPMTPSRLAPPGLAARIAMGAFCGATLAGRMKKDKAAGAFAGAIGALIGSSLGHRARSAAGKHGVLVSFPAAVLEDVIAVGGAELVAGAVNSMERKLA